MTSRGFEFLIQISGAVLNCHSFKFIPTETMWFNLLHFWLSILCLPGAIFVNIINLDNVIHCLLWNKFMVFSIFRVTSAFFFLLYTLRWSLNILWSLKKVKPFCFCLIWATNDSVQDVFIGHQLYPSGRTDENDKTMEIDSGMFRHLQTHVEVVY